MKNWQHWSHYTSNSASTPSVSRRRLTGLFTTTFCEISRQYMVPHARPEIGENVRERYEESRQVFNPDKICTILVQQDKKASKRFLTSIMQDMYLVDCCFIFQGKLSNYLTVQRNRKIEADALDSATVFALFGI